MEMKKAIRNFGVLFATMLLLLPMAFADASSGGSGGGSSMLRPVQAGIITFHSGWNMVSVPVNTQVSMSDVASSCGTAAYAWHLSESGYVKDSTLSPGYGYWVKGTRECSYNTGAKASNVEPVALFSGWNLVSAPSAFVQVSDYAGTCTVTGGPWHYNPAISNYERASGLVPGEAYWYRVSSSCQLQGETPPIPPQDTNTAGFSTLTYEALSTDTYRIANQPGDVACAATSAGDISYDAKLVRISSSSSFGGGNDAIPGGYTVNSVYYEPLASNAKVFIHMPGRDCYNWNYITYGSSSSSIIKFSAAGYGSQPGGIMFAGSIDNVPGAPNTKGYIILSEAGQSGSDAIMVPVYPSTSSTGALRFSDSGSPGKLFYIVSGSASSWQTPNVPPTFVSQRGTQVTSIGTTAVSFKVAAAGSTTANLCTDSDGGNNIYLKGTATGLEIGTGNTVSKTDYCSDSSSVVEFFCNSIYPSYAGTSHQYEVNNARVACPSGYTCSNGACVSGTTTSGCTVPSVPACASGSRPYAYADSNGCMYYKCDSTGTPTGSYWSGWKNRDDPSVTGDWEHIQDFPDVCGGASPIGIICQTTGGADYTTTGQNVICNPQEGFVCYNDRNKEGCKDYQVRFLCAGGSTTTNQPPVITSTTGQYLLKAGQQGTWSISAYDPEGGSLTYAMKWGDEQRDEAVASTGMSQTATLTHTYNSAGSYKALLTVYDNKGASAQKIMGITVLQASDSTIAVDSPAIDGTLKAGSTYNIKWTVSNDLRSTLGCVEAVYTATGGTMNIDCGSKLLGAGQASWTVPGVTPEGEYRIRVGVYAAPVPKYGESPAFKIAGKTVANKPPVINGIGGQTTVNVGQASTIYVSASDPEGKPLTYAFSWGTTGNPEVGVTTSNSATHTYNTAGTYTVKVFVSDDKGATAQATTQVVVKSAPISTNQPPLVSVYGQYILKAGQQGTWSVSASDPEGGQLYYTMNWADGQNDAATAKISMGQSLTLTHTYNTAGTYSALLTVYDNKGASTQKPMTLSVQIAQPVAITTQSLPSATMNAQYSYSLSASGGRAPYSWSLVSKDSSIAPGSLNINSQGTLSGIVAVSGTGNMVIRVADADGRTADKTLSLTVNNPSAQSPVWTEWKNRDGPGGSGDWETLSGFPEVCQHPLAVECQTADGADYRSTGQTVTCNAVDGLICLNSQNADGCLDYKVRFLCPAAQ